METKLKVGDKVLCIKDHVFDEAFIGKIGYLMEPHWEHNKWDFKFVPLDNNGYTHLNADCFILCTPMVDAIYAP